MVATGGITFAEVGAMEPGLILKEEDCDANTGVAKIEAPAEDTEAGEDCDANTGVAKIEAPAEDNLCVADMD